MPQGPNHIVYKKIAVDILKDRGFSSDEIFFEYNIDCKVDGHIKYIVDVAGIREASKMAIECGHAPQSKLLHLRRVFDEVLVVNPAEIIKMYERWRSKWYTDVTALKREINNLQQQLAWISKDADRRVGEMVAEVESLQNECRTLKKKLNLYNKVLSDAWKTLQKEQS